MNLVYQHKTGGRLWQGGLEDVEALIRRPGATGIKAVALMAIEIQPPEITEHYDVLRGRLDDNFWPMAPEYSRMSRVGDDVSELLARYLRAGHDVLSSCAAGLNRSGLATALTIHRLTNASADTCIDLVRRARGRFALSNPAFRQIVREKAGTRPAVFAAR